MIRQRQLSAVRAIAVAVLATAVIALGAGCKPKPAATGSASQAEPPCTGAATPDAAVTQLVDALRRSRLDLIPCRAVPAELLPPLEQAWREDRSRWPLSELPLSARFPKMLEVLNKPGAELALKQGFNRQFAGQTGELQSAARGLGLFAVRYVQKEADYSPSVRAHHADLIVALTDWSSQADLGNRDMGYKAIHMLVDGAKASGVHDPAGMKEAGMVGSLRQLAPLYEAIQRVTTLYGLPLDDVLASFHATTLSQQGDTAKVGIRYQLAGKVIEVEVDAARRAGRWYTAGMIESARAAVDSGSLAPQEPRGPTSGD